MQLGAGLGAGLVQFIVVIFNLFVDKRFYFPRVNKKLFSMGVSKIFLRSALSLFKFHNLNASTCWEKSCHIFGSYMYIWEI